MGWYFGSPTRKELIRELTESELTTHRKCIRGNVLWAVQENKALRSGKFIVAYLMEKGPADCGWGYKPIEECMGPAETSCPLSYFDEVPIPDGAYGARWREKVKARYGCAAA